MNPDIILMLDEVLSRGLRAMVLTNAMKPMRKLGRSNCWPCARRMAAG